MQFLQCSSIFSKNDFTLTSPSSISSVCFSCGLSEKIAVFFTSSNCWKR